MLPTTQQSLEEAVERAVLQAEATLDKARREALKMRDESAEVPRLLPAMLREAAMLGDPEMARSNTPGRALTLEDMDASQSFTITEPQRYFRSGWERCNPGRAEAFEPALGTLHRADVLPRALVMEIEAHTRGNNVISFPGAVSTPGAFIQWAQGLRRTQGRHGHGTVSHTETKRIVQEEHRGVRRFALVDIGRRAGSSGRRSAMVWSQCRK